MSFREAEEEEGEAIHPRGRGTFINKEVWDLCKACSPQVKCLAQSSLVFYISFVQIFFISKFMHYFLIYWTVSEFVYVR